MKKKWLLIPLVILLGVIPLHDLFIPGVYWSHDFVEHAARLASFYQSLKEGNLVPRWGGNLNYSYGHPVLMFLYPFTNYLGSLIHFFGLSIVDSLKVLFALSYVFSGLFMYLWIKELWGEKAGVVAAVLYMFAPYRFVDIYVRAALGEHLALTFVPLVCYGLTKLFRTAKFNYVLLTGFSLSILILSHNALSLMFLPFILFYIYFLFIERKKKSIRLRSIFIALLLGFALSAFFWVPAFWEGKYTLREIVTPKEFYANAFINWKELFISSWGYGYSAHNGIESGFMVSLSWFQWLALAAGIFLLFWKKSKANLLAAFLIVYFIASAFLTTNLSSPLLKFLPLVQQFQFPWRFLAIPVFAGSVLAGWITGSQGIKLNFVLVFILTGAVILSTCSFWKIERIVKEYSDSDLYSKYTGTTDTGESTPRWAIRFMESYPPSPVQLAWGKLDSFSMRKWVAQEHVYTVSAGVDSQIADNTLYFPGWKVYVDGREVPVQFQDQNWRGIITYPVPAGTHQIVVKFTRTLVRVIADWISIAGLFVALALWVINKNGRLDRQI